MEQKIEELSNENKLLKYQIKTLATFHKELLENICTSLKNEYQIINSTILKETKNQNIKQSIHVSYNVLNEITSFMNEYNHLTLAEFKTLNEKLSKEKEFKLKTIDGVKEISMEKYINEINLSIFSFSNKLVDQIKKVVNYKFNKCILSKNFKELSSCKASEFSIIKIEYGKLLDFDVSLYSKLDIMYNDIMQNLLDNNEIIDDIIKI